MTQRELIYVKTIADEGSISKAAQKLYVTQPSLSHCVQRIEESLGTKLFVRNPTGLTLTYVGERYYSVATEILQIYNDFELEVGEISEVVESEYGYHIILRLSVDPEDYRTTLASARLDDTLYQRVDGQTVEYTDAYDSVDLGNFYTALTAFRESVSEG